MEDRELRVEDGRSLAYPLDHRSSILNLLSSILNSRFSILYPPSSILYSASNPASTSFNSSQASFTCSRVVRMFPIASRNVSFPASFV